MQPIQLIVPKQSALFDVGKQADITIFDAPNLDYLFFLCDKSSDRCLQECLKSHLTLLLFQRRDFAGLQKISKVFFF